MASPPVNPYAPPKAADLPMADVALGDFDIGRTAAEAWESCKKHFPLWLGVTFVGGLLSVVSMFTIIGYFVLVPVFFWGGTKFLLNMIDNNPSFDDLFAGFKNYLSVLGRTLLLGVIVFGLALVSESLVFVGQYLKSTPLIIFGYLVYFAVFATVLVRLYFAFFLIVDRDMRTIDSLAMSWRMTQGKALKVVGLSIVATLIALSGVFACLVGVIWTGMMSWLMWASAYRQMSGPRPQPAFTGAW